MRSVHEMPRIVRRQRVWKTSSLCAIMAYLFHVSHAYIAVQDHNGCVQTYNFRFKLMVVDYHNYRTKPL